MGVGAGGEGGGGAIVGCGIAASGCSAEASEVVGGVLGGVTGPDPD